VRAFFGKRGPNLALDVLQLRHLIDEVLPEPADASAVPLSADMTLGQALAALAAVRDDTVLAVDGTTKHHCAARALRERIAADVKAAAQLRVNQEW
jgi:hypothetical protein